MMHHDKVVVAITDTKNKAYREYDFSSNKSFTNPIKESTVYVPFDSEYSIMLKNTNSCRILVNIDIDGTNVTNDGIIIDAYDNIHLERFIDKARKFKFVRADSDEVSDPTSEDNGIIKIEIQKEIVPFIPVLNGSSWVNTNDYWVRGSEYSSNLYSNVLISCNMQNDVGATIEGSISNQKFVSANWKGNDGNPYIFVFHLKGKSEKMLDPEYETYLRLQKKFE